MLEKHRSGWRLVQDSYEEPDLFGLSPDLKPGSWSAVWTGFPSNGTLQTKAPQTANSPDSVSCTWRTYNYTAAKNYATSHCTASTYNANYCNYNACGSDCANFVSQCFRAGNQVDGAGWNTFNGACGTCGTIKTYAGTDTWANNSLLRSWAINNGRAVQKSNIDELGIGDIINYDWTGNGSLDHVTIMVDPANNLICSHNVDRCSVDWRLGGASSYRYTWMQASYCA
jgi:hypothetical protein